MKNISKIMITSVCFLSFSNIQSIASTFQADDDFMAKFEICKAISKENDRLKCFEGLKLKSNNKENIKAQKMESKKEAPKTFKEKEQNFGADRLPENVAKKEKQQLKKMTAPLIEIQQSKYGRNTFFLGNGQVWQQQSSDRYHNIRAKKYTDVSVTIKRKMFGNHSLYFGGRTIKVKRIK